MDESKCKILKSKSVELLQLLYFQNDFKYKFRPEKFNELVSSKEKLSSFSPKSCRYFKKIVKFRNNKNKKFKHKANSNGYDFKKFKKIQDVQNVNDALQEATVLDRISVLKKNGTWSREALPKLMEPYRSKTHWDYLLDEVEWFSTDIKNRFNWKVAAAKIIAESAKTYVFIKDEIKSLEYIQMQEEARLHCSRVARMVKAWWQEKNKHDHFENIVYNTELDLKNNESDFCQMWLSNNLINVQNQDDKLDVYDKSDSDSLCSFDSSDSHFSVMLNDEHIYINESSSGMSNTSSDNSNLINELSWLENDMELNDSQMKISFESEINELKILSQTPLECIIDESYFLNTDLIDSKSISSSDSFDTESLLSDVLSHENNEIFNKTEMCSLSVIVTKGEKIQEILSSISLTEPIMFTSIRNIDELLKNESISRNIQVICELIKQKKNFSLVSSLQCSDDKLIISIFLAYQFYKFNDASPQLIITTRSQIAEWYSIIAKICPNSKIVIFDEYTLKNAFDIIGNIGNTKLLICIVSYAALSSQFCLSSIKWHNIIYDQIEKLCENASSVPENLFLSNTDLLGVRIGLISEDSHFPTKNHSLKSFLRLFYSVAELNELLNEYNYSDVSRSPLKCYHKLKKLVQNHCVPLQRIYDPGSSYQIIMCELTQIQQILHNCVVNKLKKSLESNNLLDIVEAVSQDIQLSQHPNCFEFSSDSEMEIFNNVRNHYHDSYQMSTYFLSNHDKLTYYLPKKVSYNLLYKGIRFIRGAFNNILFYNLCDLGSNGFTKYEALRMNKLLISTANVDLLLNKIPVCTSESDEEFNQNVKVHGDIHNCSTYLSKPDIFLSENDLDTLKFELKVFGDGNGINFKSPNILIPEPHENEIPEKDSQMSSTLAARRSKTKFKSRLTSLSKEYDKYSVFLGCSDYYYFMKCKIFLTDLNVRPQESSFLSSLCSISTYYIDITANRFKIYQDKVVASSPKLVTGGNSDVLLTNDDSQMIKSMTKLFGTYFAKAPRINSSLQRIPLTELNLSGKLQTLNSVLLKLSHDLSIKSCIILSHNFELLNLIESLIIVNNNYGDFKQFRISLYKEENDKRIISIIDKFNKCQQRNNRSILLVHARMSYHLLRHINTKSCSIIIADSHWQTDSDQVIFKLINRWGISRMLSQENGICSIYKLCTFESLEQYFLNNDLSFLYDDSYSDKHGLVTTTSAIVTQQSLLKNFVDKLLSPLKEELISGFCIDDFQPTSQKKSNLLKLPNESLNDILNSFENPYDLLQLCHYHSAKKRLYNEFNHLGEISKELNANNLFHQIQLNEPTHTESNFKDICKKENYRIKRQNKLNHLLDIANMNDSLWFYDAKLLELQKAEIWLPPLLDESARFVQSELMDMYDLNPIRDTELSIHLLPTKSYPTKSNKKWDDKTLNLNCSMKENVTSITHEYSDVERIKRRKLSNDFQLGEYNQYSLNQKKRKIFTNRRYYTENETDMMSGQNLKARYKIERKIMNEPEMQNIEIKEILDIKKQSPTISEQPSGDIPHSMANQSSLQNSNSLSQSFDIGKSNSILLCTNDNLIKINIQRPFYSKEGLRTLKIKRQQLSTGNMSSLVSKANMGSASNAQNYTSQQRATHGHKGQLFLNNKLGNNQDAALQSNGETEYDKLPEWNIHEEAVLYQNISHFQDHPFSINTLEKSLPNFKISEHYLNYYSITNTHRSNDMCKIHFTKLQMGYLNQNKGDNNLTRLNRQSNILNPSGVSGIRSNNETRPVIGGVTGRKLKIKMKNSIGTYGTSIIGSTQAMTNKIKMFQCFLNDMKLNLMQTNQIVNSCLNSFDSRTTMTFKMLDEVVNTSKLPSLMTNHSQTIKKNATHISALEEHSIHPDKIFTPAMLIQRREEMDRDRESESTLINTNSNRQQIVTSVSSSSYRNVGYFEANPVNSSTHSLNHIRRTTSNIGSSQNLYSLQTASNSQVISRARYNLPINRQMTGATVIHQPNTNQIQSSSSSITSSITSSSNSTLPQNQLANLGSRSQSVQFQHNRSNTYIPRRTSTQQVFQRLVYPNSHQSIRQNQLINRGSTSFVRSIIPTVVNQSNSQNTTTNNSISVFSSSIDQNNSGINRTLDRNVNFNITNQIRGHNARTNIATVSSTSRGNINQMPRMLHINQINRNNINSNSNNNRNQEQ